MRFSPFSYQTLHSPQQRGPWLFSQSKAASSPQRAWVSEQWPCLNTNITGYSPTNRSETRWCWLDLTTQDLATGSSHMTLYPMIMELQCQSKLRSNSKSYQCVPVQWLLLCCQTDHNHTAREASTSSSHHWEKEKDYHHCVTPLRHLQS